MTKIIFTAIFLSFFTSCSTKQSFIIFNDNIYKSSKHITKSIGIKSIELPQYLLSKEISFLKNGNEIIYLKDKTWVTYLDDHLTNRVISTLQKSFNTPKIYKYPYDILDKPDIIIQITINKFIADEKQVLLDAAWKVDGQTTHKNRLFSIKVPINSKEEIVSGMNKAFSAFEKELIEYLED